MRSAMKKVLREPLVRFLFLGAVIFAASSYMSRDRTDKPGEIVVTRGRIEALATGFTRTWQRPPTEQEMLGLVRDYAREEAAYRAAMAQGLDRDDTVIRKRLRQKLEFLSEDLTAKLEPTDADLEEYLRSHPREFQADPTFTFRHVYLNPDKHGTSLDSDARSLLAQLQRAKGKIDFNSVGDLFLLQDQFEKVSLSEVSHVLGTSFANSLPGLPIAQWSGPVKSGYGMHLVFVTESNNAQLRPLVEVRNDVLREWRDVKRLEALDNYYAKLLRRYDLKIEPVSETKLAEAR